MSVELLNLIVQYMTCIFNMIFDHIFNRGNDDMPVPKFRTIISEFVRRLAFLCTSRTSDAASCKNKQLFM